MEITKDESKIYEEDKLERKSVVEILKKFIKLHIEKGKCVLINGKFGEGKTTVLKYLEEELKNSSEKIQVLNYNVWQNNYYEEPLVPLLSSLSCLKSICKKLKDASISMVRKIPKIIFSTFANVHFVDAVALTENENICKEYKIFKNAIGHYKQTLTSVCKDKPLVVIVDELDRCLPEYQITFLERLHHIFCGTGNLFILVAVDQTQLEQSIKLKFGNDRNTDGYLYKFFDYFLNLPIDRKNDYLSNYFMDKVFAKNILQFMDLSVRDGLKYVSEYNLLLESCELFKNRITSNLLMLILLVKHKSYKTFETFFKNQHFNIEHFLDHIYNVDSFMSSLNEDVRIYFQDLLKSKNLSFASVTILFIFLLNKSLNVDVITDDRVESFVEVLDQTIISFKSETSRQYKRLSQKKDVGTYYFQYYYNLFNNIFAAIENNLL